MPIDEVPGRFDPRHVREDKKLVETRERTEPRDPTEPTDPTDPMKQH